MILDPAALSRIATALAEHTFSSNIDKRFQAKRLAKTFLDDQLKQLKVRLEEAEKKTLEFAQKEQIVATNEKASTANNLCCSERCAREPVSERFKNETVMETGKKTPMPSIFHSSLRTA